jgi:dihydroorotate dehydrogenase
MYQLLKRILFLVPPEQVHGLVMSALDVAYRIPLLRGILRKCYGVQHQGLARTVWGIRFPNPVGLAAGFDKNAAHIDALACLGFGFVEIGTVTPRLQPGNDKPRLFRLPVDRALINRMGFNNEGASGAAERLRARRERIVVGGNIGKNKHTPNEEAVNDYVACYNALYREVDYFVVNVSSPNTPGLRALQDKEPLTKLLSTLQELNQAQTVPKPILLKIAPDLSDAELNDIVDIVKDTRTDGIIATNTTINRAGLATPKTEVEAIGAGGLSGLPVRERSTEVVRYLHQRSNGTIPIIAVGGIFNARDAQEKLAAGATLVQIYTGFVYEGPGIVKAICKGLSEQS